MASEDNCRSWEDSLFRAIIGTALLLGMLFVGLIVYWGAGPVLFETPWYIPTMHSFAGLAALSIAFLALGRYQVLRDPAAYWIGLAFAAFGLESVFFILTWPGLLPGGRGLIAQLPNTSGWIALLELSSLNIFLLAALLGRWPGEQALTGRRWLGSVVAWLLLITLLASLGVVFEQELPLLVGPQGNLTLLLLSWDWLFMLLFAGGAVLSTRRYQRSGDTLLGYVALTQLVLAFVVLTALIGARRYDLWYYLSRLLLVGGFLMMMFGLLSEYVQLFRGERDKIRELHARSAELLGILHNSPDAVLVTDEQGGVRFASQKALDLLGVERVAELARPIREWAAPYEVRDRAGRLLSGEELPLARVGRGETLQGEEVQFRDLRTGLIIWLLASGGPLLDDAGQRSGGLLVGTDITERRRTEEALRTNEQKLRALFELLPVGISILDQERRIVEANPALQQILGLSNQELATGSYRQRQYLRFDGTAMPPDEFPTAQAIKEQRPVSNVEIGIVKEDGETIWTNVSAVPMTLADWRVVTAVVDITQRKRAETALSRSEAVLAQAGQMAHLGAWEIEFNNYEDVNANPLRWSDEVYRIFGYEPGEVAVSNDLFFARVHPDDRSRIVETVQQALAKQGPYQIEHRVIRPDGTERIVLEHAEITFDSQGRPRHIVGAVQDITERKQAEQQISQLTRLYATLSQVNQTIVRAKEPAELYQTICQVAVDYGEFSLAWIGLLDQEVNSIRPVASASREVDQLPVRPINIQAVPFNKDPIGAAIRAAKVVTGEDDHSQAAVPFQLRGQTIGVLNLHAPEAGFFKAEEEVRLLGEMGLDISYALDRLEAEAERQRAEAALRESEEKYAALFYKSAVPARLAKLPDGVYVDVNEAFEKTFGYSRQELIGKTSDEVGMSTPEARAAARAEFQQRGWWQGHEQPVRTKSGEVRIVSVNVSAVEFGGQKYAIMTAQDITERKLAEKAVARAAERATQLQTVTAALSGAVTPAQVAEVIINQAVPVLGAGGGWVFWLTPDGQELETIATVGYPAELVERWRRVPLTADVPIIEAIRLNQLLVIGSSEALSAQYADVTPHPSLVGSRVVVPMEVHGQVVGGLSFTFAESREFSPADQEFMQTLAGQCAQALERARLYEQSQAELAARRQAEERLTVLLQEKEVLLREVHHRVRNNLQAIFNLLYLQADYLQDEPTRQMLQDIQARIKSIALVHEKLYQTGNLAELNFAEYLTSLAHYLLQTYGARPERIALHIETEVETLDLDTAVPLGIIINELVSNALQYAFPEGEAGEIRIELRMEEARQLRLIVSDNGVGLPQEVDLTTVGSLGLQLVGMLTSHMRGQLDLQRNGGTTFKIQFRPLWSES